MEENIRIANNHALVLAGLFLVSLALFAMGRNRPRVPAILLVLLVLHPAWTMSASMGECGDIFKRGASWVVTVLAVLALCWQIGRALYTRIRGRPPGPRTESGQPWETTG
jgi:hypothetical protein